MKVVSKYPVSHLESTVTMNRTDLKALESANVHHIICLVRHNSHHLESHLHRFGLKLQPSPQGVFQNCL